MLDDAINGTDRSDRFEVSWRLDDPRVERAVVGRLDGDARPTRPDDVALPEDFESLRRMDPDAAALLRESSRERFADAVGFGATVRFTGTGYVFDRADVADDEEETR